MAQPGVAAGEMQRLAAAQPASEHKARGAAPAFAALAHSAPMRAQHQALQRVLDSPRMAAQRQALRRFERAQGPPVQRVDSAVPAIPAQDHVPQFHTTSMLARASLVPLASSAGGERYKAEELWVSQVRLSNDRPPTKFGGEGQRSHTVAWSLLRNAIQGMSGQQLDHLLAMLADMAADLQQPANSQAASNAFDTVKASLDAGLNKLGDAGTVADFAYWQLSVSQLIGKYVHAYQLSDEATYADGLAVGHGEPSHMKTLRFAEFLAKFGSPQVADQLPAVKLAAVGLLDIKARLGDRVRAGILRHWINSLHLAYPVLMSKYGADIAGALELDPLDHGRLTGALGKDPTAPDDAIRDKPVADSVVTDDEVPRIGLHSLNRSSFTANVALAPNAAGTQRDVTLTRKQRGLKQQQAALGLAHYAIHEVTIDRLDVADDRPNTRFGALQRSHTVAWTLVRRHLINFKGKSGAALANFVLNELTTLKSDIDSPEHNSKITFDAPGEAEEKRAALGALVSDANGQPLFRWQALLSDMVETYITLYQLSRSATYSKEEVPKGHGEATAIQVLQQAEDELATDHAIDPEEYAADNGVELVAQSVKLVDAAVATSSLQPQNWKIAIQHWLHLLEGHFPKVNALPGFKAALESEVSVMEPREELLAGYKNPATLSERDKVLINLYENAKREVKQVPGSFLSDLQSSIRMSLAEFAPPNYDVWHYAVQGLQLSKSLTSPWWKHIAEYGKPPSRTNLRDVPDTEAIATLIVHTQKYFEAVKADRDGLIEAYAQKLGERTSADGATAKFVVDNVDAIKLALGGGIDEALELSAMSTVKNYQTWFDLINKIEKDKEVNYTALLAAIDK